MMEEPTRVVRDFATVVTKVQHARRNGMHCQRASYKSPSRKDAIKTHSPTFCSQCLKIDFREVIDCLGHDNAPSSQLVAEMNGLDLSCTLCRLFSKTILPGTYRRMPTDGPWKLRAFRLNHMSVRSQDASYFKGTPRAALYAGDAEYDHINHINSDMAAKQGLLCLARTKGLKLHHVTAKLKKIPRSRLTSPQYRPDLVRRWLANSNEMENNTTDQAEGCQCRDAGKKPAIPPVQIRGMKVIDCQTLKIIKRAEHMSYVALSYVWRLANDDMVSSGHSTTEDGPSTARSLPPVIPRVVHNAITVTQDLGYRYLWVDQSCIDQFAPQEVVIEHVSQMDLIYSLAEVTIIAASTQGALPGVGTTRRVPQKVLVMKDAGGTEENDITFFTTKPSIDTAISDSVWFTRGWCFQEAILSPRRLFFTDHELYFETNNVWRSESYPGKTRMGTIVYPAASRGLSLGIPSWVDHLKEREAEGEFSLDDPRGVFWAALSVYMDLLRVYVGKNLSLESDVLNAFTGVMKAFSRRDPNFQTLQGMPIFHPFVSEAGQSGDLSSFRDWAFVNALFWTSLTLGRTRRDGFPSWSWASQTGKPHWYYAPRNIHGHPEDMGEPRLHIQAVESASGEVVELSQAPDFFQGLDKPKFLLGEAIEVPRNRLMLRYFRDRLFEDSRVSKLYTRAILFNQWATWGKYRVEVIGIRTNTFHEPKIAGLGMIAKTFSWSNLNNCFTKDMWHVDMWHVDPWWLGANERMGLFSQESEQEIARRLDDGSWSCLLMSEAPGYANLMIVSWDRNVEDGSHRSQKPRTCTRVGLARILNNSQSGSLFTENNPDLGRTTFRLG